MPETNEELEPDYTYALGKEATSLQRRFADFIISDEVGYSPASAKTKEEAFREGVRMAVALRIPFQASTTNREATAEERETRNAEREQEAAERERARAERAAKPKAEPEETTTDPVPKKAPAKKAAAKKAAPAPASTPATAPAAPRPAARRAPARKATAAAATDAPF